MLFKHLASKITPKNIIYTIFVFFFLLAIVPVSYVWHKLDSVANDYMSHSMASSISEEKIKKDLFILLNRDIFRRLNSDIMFISQKKNPSEREKYNLEENVRLSIINIKDSKYQIDNLIFIKIVQKQPFYAYSLQADTRRWKVLTEKEVESIVNPNSYYKILFNDAIVYVGSKENINSSYSEQENIFINNILKNIDTLRQSLLIDIKEKSTLITSICLLLLFLLMIVFMKTFNRQITQAFKELAKLNSKLHHDIGTNSSDILRLTSIIFQKLKENNLGTKEILQIYSLEKFKHDACKNIPTANEYRFVNMPDELFSIELFRYLNDISICEKYDEPVYCELLRNFKYKINYCPVFSYFGDIEVLANIILSLLNNACKHSIDLNQIEIDVGSRNNQRNRLAFYVQISNIVPTDNFEEIDSSIKKALNKQQNETANYKIKGNGLTEIKLLAKAIGFTVEYYSHLKDDESMYIRFAVEYVYKTKGEINEEIFQ